MKDNRTVNRIVTSIQVVKTDMATGAPISDTTTWEFPDLEVNDLSNVVTVHGNYSRANPHRYQKSLYGAVVGTQIASNSSGGVKTVTTKVGGLGQASVWDLMDSTNVYNAALSELTDQVRGTLDLSVSLAQAGQVGKMVGNVFDIVHYVRKFPSHALKSMWKEWRTSARRSGSGWLAFQYGWKPLAQDVYQSANRILGGVTNLCEIRVRQHDQETVILRSGIPSSGITTTQRIVRKVRVEIKVKLDISTTSLQDLSGFTSLNPASIAWELVPFSFVVDWVVDVGGYLRNMETALMSQQRFHSGYATTTGITTNDVTEFANWFNDTSSLFHNASGASRAVYFNRQVLNNYPIPDLPRFKAVLGSGRLLNAAALLSQHIGK